VRAVFLAVLILGLYPLGSSSPADNPSLLKVPKAQANVLTVLKRCGIEVLQELQTCYIIRADRTDISDLRANGIGLSLLARNAGGRAFLLVQARTDGTIAALRALGRVALVEPETILFWTDAGDPADSLPDGLRWKRLSDQSLVSRLRPASPAVPAAAGVSISAESDVALIVGDVSTDNLRSLVSALESFQTRYTYATGCSGAAQYIYDYLAGLGLDDVRFQSFSMPNGTPRNVIADKAGTTYPDDIVIVCGHYDSTSQMPSTIAPGADDNGSGTAAVLETARVLASHDFDFTVRFIAFAGEEQGLYGSTYYAAQAAAGGERIVAVINLDMIAYADALPEDVSLIVNGASSWLADRMAAAAASYAGLTSETIVNASFTYSDHAPFWDQGYTALLAIEDEPLANPYYHKTTDTSATIDFGFFTSVTKTAVAIAAELGQPSRADRPATPAGLTTAVERYASLFKTIKKVILTWTEQGDAIGYNVYRTTLSHESYEKLNAAPLTAASFADGPMDAGLSYYYVVTAVGATGLESNNSSEAGVAASAPAFAIKSRTAGSDVVRRQGRP
jgi:hypothetical protein